MNSQFRDVCSFDDNDDNDDDDDDNNVHTCNVCMNVQFTSTSARTVWYYSTNNCKIPLA